MKSVSRFVSPLEDEEMARGDRDAAVAVPSSIIRLGDRLTSNQGRSKMPMMVVGGALVLALVVLAMLAASKASPAQQPRSLIDVTEKEGPQGPARASPPPLEAPPAVVAPVVVAAPAPLLTQEPRKVEAPRARQVGADAKAVDDILTREYAGKRPVLGSQDAPVRTTPELPSFAMRAVAGNPSAAIQVGPKRWGIPIGTEISVKLTKPLDTRLTNIVVAKLTRPFALRGDLIFPSGTMVYGQATQSGGRFDVRLSRIKLPDGLEVPFAGVAYDLSDKKPGLSPSRRIASVAPQGAGLGEQVAKASANILIGKVAGNDAADVARSAGQTVLNGQGDGARAASQDALLLDAPSEFTVFVTEAF